MSKMIIAAVAVLSMAAVAPAFAADAPAKVKVLNTAAVDFRDPAAAQAFYAKLERTAAAVCYSNSANPIAVWQDAACTKQTLADAVSRLAQPTVTALYNNAHDNGVNLLASR